MCTCAHSSVCPCCVCSRVASTEADFPSCGSTAAVAAGLRRVELRVTSKASAACGQLSLLLVLVLLKLELSVCGSTTACGQLSLLLVLVLQRLGLGWGWGGAGTGGLGVLGVLCLAWGRRSVDGGACGGGGGRCCLRRGALRMVGGRCSVD